MKSGKFFLIAQVADCGKRLKSLTFYINKIQPKKTKQAINTVGDKFQNWWMVFILSIFDSATMSLDDLTTSSKETTMETQEWKWNRKVNKLYLISPF